MSKFVLIPGAGGMAWYWHRVVPELTARGHQAVAVDLPGDDESVGLPEYAVKALAAIGDDRDVVVVGQSLGGFTAVAVCARVPVRLLVLVNAIIPLPGETPGQWFATTGSEEARNEPPSGAATRRVSISVPTPSTMCRVRSSPAARGRFAARLGSS